MKETTRNTLNAAINATKESSHTLPVSYVIAELRQFQQQINHEEARFVAKGLSHEFLQLGDAIADELEQRETTWSNQRFKNSETKALALEATEWRHQLTDDLELALWHNAEGMQALHAIGHDQATENIVFGLKRLIELARTHWTSMLGVGMTQAYLDEAEAFYQRFSAVFAHQKEQQSAIKALKQQRNKAKAFAISYCTLIRRYAQTIYRKEPEKKALFVSSYYQHQTKKESARRKAEQPAADSPASH